MKKTGIIAEFNPLHNGHAYLISQARKKTGCDFVVVAMSGDFVQRGAPAIMDKSIRTKACLCVGSDLVLQLPVIASCASAELFAACGVATLAAVGVDTLVCGCETDDYALLDTLATLFATEPADYLSVLSECLKSGKSYPAARSYAAITCLNDTRVPSVLASPNNILAIEYLKAIKTLQLSMNVVLIKRKAASHHSLFMKGSFCSATALRQQLLSSTSLPDTLNKLGDFLPASLHDRYKDYFTSYAPVCEDDFSAQLQYKLIEARHSGLDSYYDISPALSNRLINHLSDYQSISQYALHLCTKETTYTHLARAMMHILLNITKKDHAGFTSVGFVPYLRVLGMRKSASCLLSMAPNDAPFITSVSKKAQLSEEQLRFMNQDIFARDLFVNVCKSNDKKHLQNDYQLPLMVE